MNILLIFIGVTGIALYLISTILIYDFHRHRNDKTPNFVMINFHIFQYVDKYKRVTKGCNRKTGPLYYLWVFSINLALFSAVMLLVVNVIVMKG